MPEAKAQTRCRARLGGRLPLLVALLLSAALPLRAQDAYRLGPEDKIRLKVFEWRASQDEIFGWSALNDEYSVDPSGGLSLPLVGEITAAGRTAEEVADLVSRALTERMKLGRQPTVAVDVVLYRPFYIVGPVARPGAYPYRPSLTLLKALSLAGGLRSRSDDTERLRRDIIAGWGDVAVLELQRDAALMHMSRLVVERAGAEILELPPEIAQRASDPAVARLVKQERAIFAARSEAYRTQMDVLAQLHSHLETEVPTQQALLDTVNVQIKTLQDELDTVSGIIMSDQTRARRLGLERAIAQLEGERLRAVASLLQARQAVNRSDLSIVELRAQRDQQTSAELRDVQAAIDQLDEKMATTRHMIHDAESSDPYAADLPGRPRQLRPTYRILRVQDGATVIFAAEETTPVEPGDTIQVEYRRDDADASSLPSPSGALRAEGGVAGGIGAVAPRF